VNDLSANYLNIRSTDPEEVQFQADIEEARRKDQEESFVGEMEKFKQIEGTGDMPETAEGIQAPDQPKEPEGPSVIDQVLEGVGNLPANITTGVIDSVENMQNTLIGRENSEALNQAARDNIPGFEGLDNAYQRVRTEIRKNGVVDKIVQLGAQFMIPWLGFNKALQATTGATTLTGKAANVMAAEGLTAYTSLDPHIERFAPILQEFGMENDFINYLSSEEGSDAENRFKTAIDSMAALTVMGPVLWGGAQGIKAAYRGVTGAKPAAKEVIKEAPVVEPIKKLDPEAENFGLEYPRVLKDDDPLLTPTDTIKTPEREALRADIVEKTVAVGETVSGRKPIAYIMGGGGASGKGSTLDRLQNVGIVRSKGVVHVDPDDIKDQLPEFQQIINAGDSRAGAMVHEESSTLSKNILSGAIEKNSDLVLDITLGDKTKGLAKLKELKDAGYETRLYGVTIEADEALLRAVNRAKGTGRYVPLQDLLKAHKGFSDGFEGYASMVDGGMLIDNSGKVPKTIGIIKDGKVEIINTEGYTKFIEKGGLNEEAKTLKELSRLDNQVDQSAGGSKRNGGSQSKARSERKLPEKPAGRGKSQERVTPKNLNKNKIVTEKVMVRGVEKTIKRKAGDILKDMDKRLDTLESVLGEL
jgi:predicted ABC-type ATPase